ncbi:MAG: ABC transporter ATP-binding protein [Chelatococcus sp.]|jgi:ABC-type branched-subunit amino acid transport system ATPase component|uniref:ABC transporter ATP-binding protein n=1 Tax=Chelatococcus sp. TaxID=1953771 RepID=UPI0025BBA446|nr:ABC transporter ATP-binding protein [Chelatococcus sp.]MBX3538163.1 ABC transporter ATP-binding protein [Chelatococcus sp.]
MLRVENLNAYYGQSHILQDINLNVPAGQRTTVLGRNGAGKSTLLKSIANSGPRVEGQIKFEGRALGKQAWFRRAKGGLAFVPEDRRIFTHITVEENIELGRFGASADRPAIPPEQIYEWFPMLGPLRARLGGQLSGGQQQMLSVARAVASRPKILLLDEPTEGLAPVIVEDLARIVGKICTDLDITMLLVEQNIWFGRQTTSNVYVLGTGAVVFSGTWEDFDQDETIRNRHLAIA